MKTLNSHDIALLLEENKMDYFISSASFEDRCFNFSSLLKNIHFKKVLLFGTIDFDKRIAENRILMSELFNKTESITLVDLKISDPVFSVIKIINSCDKLFIDDPKNILLDITTFTHESLLILFRFLVAKKRDVDKIFISYTCAKAYSCNVLNSDDKWLTKGVKELRSIMGYPGYSDPSKKNHLIILVGFEKERTMKLIEEFDFELVSLAFGSKTDSINVDSQKINQSKYGEILELLSNAQNFEISLTDPHSTKETILDYVSKYQDYNIVIAPMNNKISTIGAGMAAIENKDIQLFYMQANIYNIESYSQANDEYFFMEI